MSKRMKLVAAVSVLAAPGLLVLTAGTYGNVVRLLPPITIEDGLLDEALDVLDEAIAAAAG